MERRILIITMILGAMAVGLGAFGSHALKPILLESGRYETYQTAVYYHFFHVLALLGYGILIKMSKNTKLVTGAFLIIAGILFFSGSLYLLCLTGTTSFAYITPIGGILLITGWLYGAFSIYRF